MSQRYLVEEKELKRLINDDMTPDDLAREIKLFYNFVPTDEIMGMLAKRMIQLSDPKAKSLGLEKELWSGFHAVDRLGGKVTYHPDALLEPYMIDGKNDNSPTHLHVDGDDSSE